MNQIDCASIQFNGSDFANFISFVKSLNSKDKSKYSRLILLHVENDKLVCRAIDDDSNYIEYYVELYNNENIIDEYIAVSINDIATLIKCSDNNKFTIRRSFNQYEFNIIGDGWLPFNVAEVESDKFAVSGNETIIGKVDSAKIRDAISSVIGYTQEYTYARDKYIVFSEDQMLVTSRTSSVITSDKFVNMTLSRNDAARLKALLKDNFELTINKIDSTVEMLSFVGPKFKFIIRASGIECSDKKYISDIQNYVTVNCDELYKLITIAEDYSVSKHTVGITIKDNKLLVSIKNTLAANHISTVNSKPVGNVKNTKEAIVPTHNMLKALKLFQDKRSREVNVYFTDEMLDNQSYVIVFDQNTQAIICNR